MNDILMKLGSDERMMEFHIAILCLKRYFEHAGASSPQKQGQVRFRSTARE